MNKYSLLVNSCDCYSDLWEPFFTLLKKYWPGEIPPIVLNTETKDFSMPGLQIICAHCPDNPEGYYGKRMKFALSQIETDYVLCLLDDFFIRETVNTERLEQIVRYMDENPNISCFNFENSFEGKKSKQYPGFIYLPPVADYKLNMQAAIWRRKDYESLWKDKVDPWMWETISNKLTYRSSKEYYFLEKGQKMPIVYGKKDGMTWGVVRGKWMKEDVVPLFEREDIVVDYTQRGFFLNSITEEKTMKDNLVVNAHLLYILGPAFTIKNFLYSTVYRRICLLLGKNAVSYDMYLAEKYNGLTR